MPTLPDSLETYLRGDVTVSLPAEARFVYMLRSVVASAAAGLDFTIDDIDDLRLVLDEACGQVLELSPEASVLKLNISFEERSMTLTVTTDAPLAQPPPDHQDSMAWRILSTLSDSVEFMDGQDPAIRLTKSGGHTS